jgi:MinD superfamily P-loop ATPase
MKQLLILSGKGGTGKTTVAGAFIKLAAARAYADCDVDAPNLHLIIRQTAEPRLSDFYGMPKADINRKLCVKCGRCEQRCRFDAVLTDGEGAYFIDPFSCEGCGVCQAVCPASAISLKPEITGSLMLYSGGDVVFSTAQLKMGSGNSGKLVSEVKRQMKAAAPADAPLAVIDGSPGIGCPVISSASGVNMVLIVTEPSVSGFSDLERIVKTARTFHIKIAVCINRFDINLKNTEKIEDYCKNNGIFFAGRIPYDPEAVKAANAGLTLADIDSPSGSALKEVYDRTMSLLYSSANGG